MTKKFNANGAIVHRMEKIPFSLDGESYSFELNVSTLSDAKFSKIANRITVDARDTSFGFDPRQLIAVKMMDLDWPDRGGVLVMEGARLWVPNVHTSAAVVAQKRSDANQSS